MKIIICDDEARECHELRCVIKDYFQGIKNDVYITEYHNGEELLYDVEEGRENPDLIFLDIFMDGINGYEAAQRLRKNGCKTPLIFLTTSRDFAVESYDVDAAGYLVKPLDVAKLTQLMDKLTLSMQRKRIAIKISGDKRYFYGDEIVYLESENKITNIVLSDGSTEKTREKLSDIQERLTDKCFLRCHQSYLVNMHYIADAKEDFILTSGKIIPIRVRSHKEICDAYYHWFVEQTVGFAKEGL